jgi:hypothetical protein
MWAVVGRFVENLSASFGCFQGFSVGFHRHRYILNPEALQSSALDSSLQVDLSPNYLKAAEENMDYLQSEWSSEDSRTLLPLVASCQPQTILKVFASILRTGKLDIPVLDHICSLLQLILQSFNRYHIAVCVPALFQFSHSRTSRMQVLTGKLTAIVGSRGPSSSREMRKTSLLQTSLSTW